jgi:AcrR family transcriptional regulator
MTAEDIEKVDKELIAKRGDGTRYALVLAGLELFGEYGLKGTSTRMLSKHSGANVSAIPYYFGSKEGLYRAVVEYIVERIAVHTGEVRSQLQELVAQGPLTPEQAGDALKKMFTAMAHLFVESDEPKTWARIMVREQANPTPAFDIFYEKQMRPIQNMMTQLIAAYTGLDPDGDEIKIRGHALIGQILGFLIARESILRHLGVRKLTREHVDLIHTVVLSNIENCLKVLRLKEPQS